MKCAATRSYDARSRQERIEREHEERSADVLRLRARLEKTYDAKALRIADQICDRALGQFVDGLLHEVQKVAMPLQGTLDELRTNARSGASDRAQLAATADKARGMLDLLVRIAVSARDHAQVKTPTFREVKVAAFVDEQLELLRARIGGERTERLRVEIDIDPVVTVEADPVLLAQAFANLLQNAVEAYSVEGTAPIFLRVGVEPRKIGNLIAISIQDRGAGIRKDEVAHLGEPFFSSKAQAAASAFSTSAR